MKWECLVKVNGIPVRMVCEMPNLITAKSYFETFGKMMNEPRILNDGSK